MNIEQEKQALSFEATLAYRQQLQQEQRMIELYQAIVEMKRQYDPFYRDNQAALDHLILALVANDTKKEN